MSKLSAALWRVTVVATIALPVAVGHAQPSFFGLESEKTCCSYEVTIEGAPNDAIADTLEKALYLYRFQDAGAPSIPLLRRRAESDQDIVKQVMRSFGYYEARARSDVVPGEDGLSATVTMRIKPGRAFLLAEHRIAVAGDEDAREIAGKDAGLFGSPVGEAAAAAPILEAETAVVQALQNEGFPYAARLNRDAVADLEKAEISVQSFFKSGPQFVFGEVTFEGIPDIDAAYLQTYQPWRKGETVDVRQLTEYQRDLIATGLFNAGSVTLPEQVPEGEAAPVAVVLEQRPFRTVAAGVSYSTSEGPLGRLEFEHRNLFGANETVNLRGDAGIEEQKIEGRFRKPQFRRNGQDLVAGFNLRNLENDAFDERGGTVTLGLERRLTPELIVGLGGLAEVTQTKSSDAEGLALLVGLPAYAGYNSTDDALNPTDGIRARASVTPFIGSFDHQFASFLRTDVTASTYFNLSDSGRYVIALRGRVGSILAKDLTEVPAGRRLYSGGGGSVRGYKERFIGPLDSNNDPTGGLSVIEGGAEFRARIYGDFGAAVFLEAGSVSEEVAPTFSEGVQYAAGAGLRYYSPIGPIRVDVGVPLNGRSVDDDFQIYFSIGQAF